MASTPSRSSLRYWRSKIYRKPYLDSSGVKHLTTSFYVRVQHGGRRRQIALGSSDIDTAAAKARDTYARIQRDGWDALEATRTPVDEMTVGEYIKAATAVADVSPASLKSYTSALRLIVAQALEVPSENRNSDPSEWRARVDALRLADLTPAAIQQWKLVYAAKAASPEEAKRRKTSCNAYLRNARSLFSKAIAKHLDAGIENPFSSIDLFPRSSHRYQSRIDAERLLSAATELPEPQLQIIILALLLGLRKNEIDKVTWELFDLGQRRLNLRPTKHLRLKSETSAGVVPIDVDTVALLRGWKAKATGEFVVEAEVGDAGYGYRCHRHFQAVYEFLRSQGVESHKPLHELRKEFGSLVCREHGIFAASRLLRHADIAVTNAHYTASPDGDDIGPGISFPKQLRVAK